MLWFRLAWIAACLHITSTQYQSETDEMQLFNMKIFSFTSRHPFYDHKCQLEVVQEAKWPKSAVTVTAVVSSDTIKVDYRGKEFQYGRGRKRNCLLHFGFASNQRIIKNGQLAEKSLKCDTVFSLSDLLQARVSILASDSALGKNTRSRIENR